MKEEIRAVITCDLVNSTKYSAEERISINKRIEEFVDKWHQENITEYLIYRGDSLQGMLRNPSQALRQAISLKSYVKSIRLNNSKRSTNADIRISIGIGTIDYTGKSLLDSDGEAFHNSGRTLDLLKQRGKTIALTTSDQTLNEKWNIILTLLDEVIAQWTITSAEIVWGLIDGWDDKKIQKKLKISQSAVSQRKKTASWDAIEKTINYYENNFRTN